METHEMVDTESVKATLFQACHSCCPKIRKRMLDTLETFEKQEGCILVLTKVVNVRDLGATLSRDCRTLAAVLLKNLALKWWPNTVDDNIQHQSQKAELVKFLTTYLDEPDCKIAWQLHSLTAKLVRLTWPNQYRDILCSFVKSLQKEDNFLVSYRSACCLHVICAELSSSSQSDCKLHRHFDELCVKLFPVVSKIWATKLKFLQAKLSQAVQAGPMISRYKCLEQLVAIANALSKTVKIVVETAFPKLMEKYGCFQCFWQTYMMSIQIFAKFVGKVRKDIPGLIQSHGRICPISEGLELNYDLDDDEEDICDYYIAKQFGFIGIVQVVNLVLKLLKTLNCTPTIILRRYPMHAIFYLKPMLKMYYNYLLEEYPIEDNAAGNDRNSGIYHDVNANRNVGEYSRSIEGAGKLKYLSLASVMFIASVLTCSAYTDYSRYSACVREQNPCAEEMDEEAVQNVQQQADEIRRNFCTTDVANALTHRLLRYFCHYSENQLEYWREQGEDFFNSEQDSEPTFTLRTAATLLFRGLINSQPDTVKRIMLSLLWDRDGQVQNLNVTSVEIVLYYDSLYYCAGIGIDLFASALSGTEWLLNVLGPILTMLMSNSQCGSLLHGQQILRGRLLWILSVYVDYFHSSTYPTILSFLVSMISVDCDIVVKLYSVKALDSLLNAKDFIINILMPCAAQAISSLCTLVQSLDESESKIRVLELVGEMVLLLGMEGGFEGLLVPLAQYLLHLFSGLISSKDVVRESVLEVMRCLVKASRANSVHVQHITLPLLLSIFTNNLSSNSNNSANSSMELCFNEGVALYLTVLRNSVNDRYNADFELLFNQSIATTLSYIIDPASNTIITEICPYSIQKKIVYIMEANVLLGGAHFVSECKVTLSTMLKVLFTNNNKQLVIHNELVDSFHRLMQTMLMVAPDLSFSLLKSVGIVKSMLCSSFTSAPCPRLSSFMLNFVETRNQVKLCYLTALARAIASTPMLVIETLEELKGEMMQTILNRFGEAELSGLTSDMLLSQLLAVYYRSYDDLDGSLVGDVFSMRVWALSLTTLLPTAGSLVDQSPSPCTLGRWMQSICPIRQAALASKEQWVWGKLIEGVKAGEWAVDSMRTYNIFQCKLSSLLADDNNVLYNLRQKAETMIAIAEEDSSLCIQENDDEGRTYKIRECSSGGLREEGEQIEERYLQALSLLASYNDRCNKSTASEEPIVTLFMRALALDPLLVSPLYSMLKSRIVGLKGFFSDKEEIIKAADQYNIPI